MANWFALNDARFIAATVNSTSSAASMNRFMDSPGATLERTLLNCSPDFPPAKINEKSC